MFRLRFVKRLSFRQYTSKHFTKYDHGYKLFEDLYLTERSADKDKLTFLLSTDTGRKNGVSFFSASLEDPNSEISNSKLLVLLKCLEVLLREDTLFCDKFEGSNATTHLQHVLTSKSKEMLDPVDREIVQETLMCFESMGKHVGLKVLVNKIGIPRDILQVMTRIGNLEVPRTKQIFVQCIKTLANTLQKESVGKDLLYFKTLFTADNLIPVLFPLLIDKEHENVLKYTLYLLNLFISLDGFRKKLLSEWIKKGFPFKIWSVYLQKNEKNADVIGYMSHFLFSLVVSVRDKDDMSLIQNEILNSDLPAIMVKCLSESNRNFIKKSILYFINGFLLYNEDTQKYFTTKLNGQKVLNPFLSSNIFNYPDEKRGIVSLIVGELLSNESVAPVWRKNGGLKYLVNCLTLDKQDVSKHLVGVYFALQNLENFQELMSLNVAYILAGIANSTKIGEKLKLISLRCLLILKEK